MGAFFTNVQVRAQDRSALVAALRARALAEEMDEVRADGSAGAPDRTILVFPPDDGGWTSIYDERSESQDLAVLEALGALASRATGEHAFTVLVHDSDVLDLRLFRDGTRVDRLDTEPGYERRRPPTKRERAAAGGDPAAWVPLLVPDGDAEALRAAFADRNLFAEETLRRIAELVGCDPRRAGTGHRYVKSNGDELPEGTVTLSFRARVRPSWETPSTEPTALVLDSAHREQLTLAVGDELRIPVMARSAGRASRGLGVRCWGSALATGIVALDRFELVHLERSASGEDRVRAVALSDARSGAGEPMRVAELADEPIPAGSKEPFAGYQPGLDMARAMEALSGARVGGVVVGRVIAPGTGEIGVGLAPLERPEAAAGLLIGVAVEPPLWAPLRSADAPAHARASHLLRPLRGERYLCVLAGLDAPRTALAVLAEALLDAATPAIAPTDAVATAIYTAGGRPKTGRGKAKTMLGAAKRAALVAAIGSAAEITLEAGPLHLAAGIGLDGDASARLPWVVASLDTAALDAGAADRVARAWSLALDARARASELVQASLFRAGWAAGLVEHTPYEAACGIAMHATTLRAWGTRWVRVPGSDRLWLGPALAERVDRGALRALGEVEALGAALRVALTSPGEPDALERALADVLPSAATSNEAVQAWHRARM